MNLNKLIELIIPLDTANTVCSESWAYITLKNSVDSNTLNNIRFLQKYLGSISEENILSIIIDNQSLEEGDLELFIENKTHCDDWEISINKQSFISRNLSDYSENFFYSIRKFEEWMTGLSPFNPQNPFHSKIRIIVNGLDEPVIGKQFQIVPVNNNTGIDFTLDYGIPETVTINKIVHSFISDDLVISPLSFIYQTGSKLQITKEFNRLACLSLSASIVNEFYSGNRITVDGIRRINLELQGSEERFTDSLYNSLIRLVSWIYEDKTLTRQKLFNDRITLELDENKSFINALSVYIDVSLNQAIQRYNFVILERKDKYVSELKDLLKDIRNQSELYSQKIRSLLNNLLRDVLAALLLVGFTLFTKFSDNLQLNKELLLNYVFYALAIYYLISIALQTMVDITDIHVSKNEILYWKKTTKELLPEKDFKEHIRVSLKGRRISLRVIYPIIVILYLLVSFSCYKFPYYFNTIVAEKETIKVEPKTLIFTKDDKVSKYKNSADSSASGRK